MWELKLLFINAEHYFSPENHQINEKEFKYCICLSYSIVKISVLRKHTKFLFFIKMPTTQVISAVRKYKLNGYFLFE